MRIGGSDIVLNQQPVARSRRHGIETRMVELQRSGLLESPHEAFHGTMIVGVQAEYASSPPRSLQHKSAASRLRAL